MVFENYYRVSYKGKGIYEALKNEIWKNSKDPVRTWELLKESSSITWLKVPNVELDGCFCYFTQYGYEMFMKKTYELMCQYFLESDILIEKIVFDNNEINVIYRDEHQIVVKK